MDCPYKVMQRIKPSKNNGYQSGYILRPCGLCMNCRKNKAREWGTRIYHESKFYLDNSFITLTYDDENLPLNKFGVPTLVKRDLQLFMKRLRDYVDPLEIRFFGVGEYGDETRRPHYHVIVFGLHPLDYRFVTDYSEVENGYVVDCKPWKLGRVHVGFVDIGSSMYVAGYGLKKVMGKGAAAYYDEHDLQAPFSLMSRRPGIGFDYLERYGEELIQFGKCQVEGNSFPLPKYYREKLDIKNSSEEQERAFERWRLGMMKRDEACKSVGSFQDYIKKNVDAEQQTVWNMDFFKRLENRGKL